MSSPEGLSSLSIRRCLNTLNILNISRSLYVKRSSNAKLLCDGRIIFFRSCRSVECKDRGGRVVFTHLAPVLRTTQLRVSERVY